MKIKLLKLKKIFLFFFTFYVLFRFYFIWEVGLQKILIFSVFLGYFLFNINIILRYFSNLIPKVRLYIKIGLLFYSLYILIAIISPVIHQTYETSYYLRLIYFNLLIISLVDIFIYIVKNIQKDSVHQIYMDYVIKATIIYILISFLFLFFPNIKDIWLNIIYKEDVIFRFIEEGQYATRWGVSGFSGFPFTIICTFALIFQINKINSLKINFKNIFILLLLFVGNIMYGRIGIVASFLCLFAWIIYSVVIMHKIRIFMYFLTILLCVLFGAVYLYFTSPEFASILHWAITPFLNLLTTGEFNNYSANMVINDMYFMPEAFTTFLFGDGYYLVDGYYYMHTDAGFMRLMLYSGVLSQIFLYGGILFLLFAVYKNLSQINRKNAFLMVILFLGAFLVFEFKGEMFFQLIAVILPLALANINIKRPTEKC